MTKAFPNSLIRAISDQKLAELNLITTQVQSAQYDVAEKQSIVDSLLAKSAQFQAYLAEAQTNQTIALANAGLATQALSGAINLNDATQLAEANVTKASNDVSKVSKEMAALANKLIFTVEIINKLALYVNKQKGMNPLIPDTLVAFLGKATTDANDAVALTLTALQGNYAAEATLLESQETIAQSVAQAKALAGTPSNSKTAPTFPDKVADFPLPADQTMASLATLMQYASVQANRHYNSALTNSNIVARQLDYAQSELVKAQTRLNSIQAGLAAANAAAYAA